MSTEFKIKTLLCDTADVCKKTDEVKSQWLQAFMRRLNVPRMMIEGRLENKVGNEQWRHYLFDNFSVDILNRLEDGKVQIIKYIDGRKDGKTEIIGEWSKPEVIRIRKRNERPYCELKLKYWQLV